MNASSSTTSCSGVARWRFLFNCCIVKCPVPDLERWRPAPRPPVVEAWSVEGGEGEGVELEA